MCAIYPLPGCKESKKKKSPCFCVAACSHDMHMNGALYQRHHHASANGLLQHTTANSFAINDCAGLHAAEQLEHRAPARAAMLAVGHASHCSPFPRTSVLLY
jgi:hypothetical protein